MSTLIPQPVSRQMPETAAAILTKIAFDHNRELSDDLENAPGKTPQEIVNRILPVYNAILKSLLGASA